MTLCSANLLECFCGRTYTYSIDLEEHRRARGHFPSHVCRDSCRHPPVAQYNFSIHKCDCCGKLCNRLDILEDHRIATGHCFCSECNLSFQSLSAWRIHHKVELHASEYRCCNCNISFKDIYALDAHMASSVHRKPLQQRSHDNTRKAKQVTMASTDDQTCKICRRTFSSFQSLRQHRESVKHKPLSALRCPIGKGCRGEFSAPSALLHHLESGKCCSGMDRDDVYDIIQLYDKDHTIHSLPTLTPSSSTHLSAHRLSPHPGTPKTSLDSADGWSLITPTYYQGSAEGSLVDWSLLKDSLLSLGGKCVVDNTEPELRCPLCPRQHRAFATVQALQQHMISPAHSDKVYHCPSNLLPIASSRAGTNQGKRRQFTTLSGLTQHLESGACYGGKQTFLHCVEFVQRHLEQQGLGRMRLLLPGSQD
ncbi:hypothetical protein B5807_01854 [Epicoccum nigrum]|uniref:C2H2-type domain-containing protein n=1 Tax=Epicoccum nigrum TaxID=105696 RepID=A0A1Y2MAT5_EPING|nr:hypothetical protein B5807_01854 [Epicoccum nigrum]